MDKNKRRIGLGRGLDTIFSEKPSNTTVTDKISNEISLDLIDLNPFQPRTHFDKAALEELKQSIILQGIIQPIAVRSTTNGRYQLISGERRYQASKMANLKAIPAYIREANDIQMLEMGIVENLQRENLNPVEIALSFKRLLEECKIKQEELGERVGKDRSTINNYLRILQLPETILNGLQEKKLSMGHARALLGLNDKNLLLKLYKDLLTLDYSVRKVEEIVKKINLGPEKKSISTIPKIPKYNLTDFEEKFTSIFGKETKVISDGKKGEIKISFSSKDELDQLISIIKK